MSNLTQKEILEKIDAIFILIEELEVNNIYPSIQVHVNETIMVTFKALIVQAENQLEELGKVDLDKEVNKELDGEINDLITSILDDLNLYRFDINSLVENIKHLEKIPKHDTERYDKQNQEVQNIISNCTLHKKNWEEHYKQFQNHLIDYNTRP